jgi:hypothetical protein
VHQAQILAKRDDAQDKNKQILRKLNNRLPSLDVVHGVDGTGRSWDLFVDHVQTKQLECQPPLASLVCTPSVVLRNFIQYSSPLFFLSHSRPDHYFMNDITRARHVTSCGWYMGIVRTDTRSSAVDSVP